MATLRASNQNELDEALKAVQGGDTILLSSGTYDELRLASGSKKGFKFSETVTIASADPSRPAEIREMFVSKASNIEISDITLDYVGYQLSSTPGWLKGRPFFIQNSQKIVIDNVEFDGHLRNGYGQDKGLRISGSTDVTVSNSEFSDFKVALEASRSEDIALVGNLITGMSHDGFNLAEVSRLLIENNRFADFKAPDPDALHKDAIQFWTGATEGPSTAVVIRGNTFDLAEVVQTIYIGNELYKAGRTAEFHRNFLIEDNDIHTAQALGIAMIHGDGVVIRDNRLVHNDDRGYDDWEHIPLINVSRSSYNVDIIGNTAANVPDEQNSTWDVSGNTRTNTKYDPIYWENHPLGRMITVATDTVEDVLNGVGTSGPRPDDADPDTGTGTGGGDMDEVAVRGKGGSNGRNETFRIDGYDMDDDTRFTVEGFDFDRDDKIIFSNFDAGSFRGKYGNNPVWSWNDAASALINSALDLQELDAVSPRFSAAAQGDDVVLRFDKDDYAAEIVFEDMADEFRAADRPELF